MPRKPKVGAISDDMRAKLLAHADANDALRHYTPHGSQALCLASKARYRLLWGVNRGGKSAHLAYEIAAAARRLHPSKSVSSRNGTYLLLAPSREQLIDPWGKKMLRASELLGPFADKPLIPEWEIASVGYVHGAGAKVPKHIRLRNGNEILFAVSGDPNIDRRLKGKMLLGIGIDEDAGTQRLIAELVSRLLDAHSDPEIVREAGGGWMLWGATDTDGNPAYMDYKSKCEDDGNLDFHAFEIRPGDNPAIKLEERERLKSAMSEQEYQIRHAGGEGMGNQLSVFGRQYTDVRHLRTTDYQIQPEDNLWVSYDDGWDHPMGLLIAAISKDKPTKLRLVKYITSRRQTLPWVAAQLAEFLRGRSLECVVYDIAMHKTERGSGRRVDSQLWDALRAQKIHVYRGMKACYNRHEPGIHLMRKYLDPNPNSLTAEPLIEFSPSQQSGIPTVRRQILAYRTHKPDEFTGNRGVVKVDDEGVDVVRYLCNARPGWTQRPPNFPKWGDEVKIVPIDERVPSADDAEAENLRLQFERSERLTRGFRNHRQWR